MPRHLAAEQREDAQREGDVGGGRDRPAGQRDLVAPIDIGVDDGRKTMPPMAPTAGSRMLPGFDSSPSMSSRLSSRPTRKRKIAIRPSLTHSSRGLAICSGPTRISTGMSNSQA